MPKRKSPYNATGIWLLGELNDPKRNFNMSLGEFAKLNGITQATLSYIIHGNNRSDATVMAWENRFREVLNREKYIAH